jgi:hypothetical protein
MLSMTLTDYLIDIALIAVVLRNIRESRFGLHAVLLPLGLLGFAASHYLTSLPTAGHDVALYVVLAAVGATVGALSGLTTHLRINDDGELLARAGVAAASLWVLGMGARMAFSLYANGFGQDAVTRFSIDHAITGAGAWTAALIFMAAGQVVVKLAVQLVRGQQLLHQVPAPRTVAAA